MTRAEAPQTREHPTAKRELRTAWWSLILYPAAFAAAFLVGQAVPYWLGYDVTTTEAPWWALVLAYAGSLVVFAFPLLITVPYGRLAEKHGKPSGKTASMLALALVFTFAVFMVYSLAMLLIFEG